MRRVKRESGKRCDERLLTETASTCQTGRVSTSQPRNEKRCGAAGPCVRIGSRGSTWRSLALRLAWSAAVAHGQVKSDPRGIVSTSISINDCYASRTKANRSNRCRQNPTMSMCGKHEKASWRANNPLWPSIAAAVKGRLCVSSRTSALKNGVLATEEGSVYGH